MELLHVAIQEGCNLAAGAGGIWIELAVANAGGDAVLDGPSHGLRVVAVGGSQQSWRRRQQQAGPWRATAW